MDSMTQARVEAALGKDDLRLAEDDERRTWLHVVVLGSRRAHRAYRVRVCDVSTESRCRRLGIASL